MLKNYTENIINNHCSKLNRCIKIVNKHFETESIHKLRVEYKKLRAFLRMISEEKEGGEKIKIPGKVKKGYYIAGSIRDLQLQHQFILLITKEEIKKPLQYLKLLERGIEELKPRFSFVPIAEGLKKIKQKSNEVSNEKLRPEVPAKFINTNCSAIVEIINSGDFTDINMHSVRKYLKDIFYTMQELKAAAEEPRFKMPEITDKEIEYFDHFLEELGNFQDKCTSIALLDYQRLNLLHTYSRQMLLRVKKTLAVDKDKIKTDLIKKLQDEAIPHLQVFCNANI